MAVSGSEVWVFAMASKKKCNAVRLEEAAGEAAVEQTRKIKVELQKLVELQKDEAFSSIEFKLSCRRVLNID